MTFKKVEFNMSHRYDIFISYRRVDSEGKTSGRDIARTIKLELEKRHYKVFFDYSEIKDNEFESTIIPAIKESKFFLLVLSKDALIRCSNESDWVRREITEAIKSNCKIIPVSPGGQFDGWPSTLPDDITALKNIQVSELSLGSLFEKSVDKIIEDRIPKKRWYNYLTYGLGIALLIILAILLYIRHFNSNRSVSVESDSVNVVPTISEKIDYRTVKDDSDVWFAHKLIARIDGYDYTIDVGSSRCIELVNQCDYNNDGKDEALVCDIQACGGNGMPNAWFFVVYSGRGFFTVTDVFGNSYKEPTVERWNNYWSVVVEDCNDGYNTAENRITRDRYILDGCTPKKVESAKKNSITNVIDQIKSDQFHDGHEQECLSIEYDLDNNGIKDVIECRYWDRWDALSILLTINGKQQIDISGYDRIGVLSTKTNGFNQLVGGEDTILVWNGKEYVEQ